MPRTGRGVSQDTIVLEVTDEVAADFDGGERGWIESGS
jgi:hypothetical protein